jgi:hypothetical protein
VTDWEVREVENENENEETEDEQETKEPENDSKQTDKQKQKAELEAQLEGLEEEIKSEAGEAAENIAEDNPNKSEVNKESKDEAAAIAVGHQLTKDEESRLAKAIAAETFALISAQNRAPSNKPPRTPDKRPKPTHFSERRILGRRRTA